MNAATPTPPRQVVFDPTPEIFATDTAGSFTFPLLIAGKAFLGTSAYDEVRFVFSIWHPSGQRTIVNGLPLTCGSIQSPTVSM